MLVELAVTFLSLKNLSFDVGTYYDLTPTCENILFAKHAFP